MTTGVDATPEAILGYIRRYSVDGEDTSEHRLVLKDCEIKTKSRVADLVIDHGPQTMKRISEFAGTIKTVRGENLRVLCGTRHVRIIADQRALAQFKQTIGEKEIVKYTENLVEVSLLLPPSAERADGICNRITTQLAMIDVYPVAFLCCTSEAIMIVREEDSLKTMRAFQELLSDTSDFSHNRVL